MHTKRGAAKLMKQGLNILFLFLCMSATAQSKAKSKVMGNARLLDETVFGTKDSATIDKLFAASVAYIHSSGKTQTRAEAIDGIIHNQSVYIRSAEAYPYSFSVRGDSAVVVHVFKAMEQKADGTESLLNLSIETVWVKVKKDWKMTRRQATKVQ